MELTKIQNKAVEEILSVYSSSEKKKVDFKAPTGSGKTLMATSFISHLIERNPQDNFVFVIATPSSANLPLFFEKKINIYKKDLPFSKFEVEYFESPSSGKNDTTEGTPKIRIIKNKVYIFGKSTFGSKRIFTTRHVIDDFADEALETGYKIIYIRDEAHIGDVSANDSDVVNFEKMIQGKAHFILKMTATPNYNDSETTIVSIKESDLNDISKNDDRWLLKTKAKLLLQDSMSEEDLLENAISQYKTIAKEYKALENDGIFIHPVMLIQVSNEPTDKDKKIDFQNQLEKIKNTLNYHNLAWVKYFGNTDKESNRVYGSDFSLDDITENNNEIDVIMFKIGPSVGWDIPRACMLIQLRKVCSDTLNIQTIGRIKRNPYPALIKNDITDTYYVYSNSPKVNENIQIFSYKAKDEFVSKDFLCVEIANKHELSGIVDKKNIEIDLCKWISENRNLLIQEIKSIFIKNDYGEDIFVNELYSVNGSVVYNSVKNVFSFLKIHHRLLDARNNLYVLTKGAISKSFDNLFSGEKLYDDTKLDIRHLEYVIFHKHNKELNEIVQKNTPFKPQYRIESTKYIPSSFIEIHEKIQNEGDLDDDNVYLFDIKKNGNVVFNQPLDSNAEKVVFNKLKSIVMALSMFDSDNPPVKVWCKNYVGSSINGEYLDKNNFVHKSHFDFILSFKNGAFLYIEVKDMNDIDDEKTDLLINAYDEYFKFSPASLDIPLFISLWKVNGSSVSHQTFYYQKLCSKDLNSLNVNQLINEISNLDLDKQ